MSTMTKETVSLGNVNVHLIPSKAFKTLTLELRFRSPINRDTVTMRTLLPLILKKGTERYPDNTLMQEYLDDLYGASLRISSFKTGDFHVLNVEMECANEKFINGESSILKDALLFLNEVVAHPYIVDGAFEESVVEREKQTVQNHLQAMKDEKVYYANTRLIDEMCQGEAYQIHEQGYEEDLADINGKNLYAYYTHLLQEDLVDLFIVGDFEWDEMVPSIEKNLKDIIHTSERPSFSHVVTKKEVTMSDPKEIIEQDQLQQAKLHIGYRTGTTFSDDNYAGMLMCTMILGGYPGSKLFINVREKHGLAYYIAAGWDTFSDKLIIYSGIAPEDYQKTRNIITEQLQALKNGDVKEEELQEAKTLLISQLQASMDEAAGKVDSLFRQQIGDKERPTAEIIRELQQLKLEDIVWNAHKIQADTVYLLTNQEVK